ncbi:MAG: beta-ketoacyl synthase N-terminal-like domain-containing protein [Gammaproteobacteria bacterium]
MAPAPAVLLGGGLVTALGRGLPAHARALALPAPAPRASPVEYGGAPLPFHFAAGPNDPDAFLRMVGHAVEEALAEARLPPPALARMGIFVGSTALDLPLIETGYEQAYAPGETPLIAAPGHTTVARDIAARFAIAGPQYAFNTACSSSANAALYARAMLAEGRLDHALVVGVEGYNRLSLLGFASLMLLTHAGYRPFDLARDGLVLGEGAGAMVLGREARPGAVRLAGAATACDPSTPTNSLPERVAEVMADALADAGLAPRELIAVKAHGTGTPSNDQSEGEALRRVCGDALPPLTSIKPYFGHTLGACGAIEMLCLAACWREGFLPATPGFEQADPATRVHPEKTSRPLAASGAVLCNFFGFGGTTTSVVLAR